MDKTLNTVTTGTDLAKKYGFTQIEAPLGAWPSDTQKFVEAPEVKEMGKWIISKWRKDLQNVNIAYVFKKKASKSGDMTTLGTAKVENELQNVLHGYDAVITIAYDTWITLSLDQCLRLVDHELMHLAQNMDTGKIGIVGHPVEEFPEIIRRWGPGTDAQVEFISAYQAFSKENK